MLFWSPSCDSKDNAGQCDNAQFSTPSTAGNLYFYQCAPWGFWDSTAGVAAGSRPAGLPTYAPTWYDTATSSWTNIPLNGVTLYFPSSVTGTALPTESGSSTLSLLGAPNPCPGTGSSFTSGSAVQFPAGVSSATYTYPTTSLVYQRGLTSSQTCSSGGKSYSLVYSNDDITALGECGAPYIEWPGAMPAPQHVNFLAYETGAANNVFYGTDDVDWQGIFYAPNAALTFTGKSADEGSSGAEGIPWLVGQVVVDHVDFHGTSSVQIAYLPCTNSSIECYVGNALQLIE